eukprot:TRINITY_DN16108_c0_g2_i2.p1 TRINITY_DN16108_c0_g2~~TRINITY_DN16108_c0_g2_i2.p1  ORF type:complete len:413 (+),score=89.19 TRINITY_DN16108_c0_g2_i2:148-1386(+)
MKGRWPQIQWRSQNLPELLEKQERKVQEQAAIPSSRRTTRGPGGLLRSTSPIRPSITEASKPLVTHDRAEDVCGVESEHCDCIRQGGSLSDRWERQEHDFTYRLAPGDDGLSFVYRIESRDMGSTSRGGPSTCSTRTADTMEEADMADVGLEGMLLKQEPKTEPVLFLRFPKAEEPPQAFSGPSEAKSAPEEPEHELDVPKDVPAEAKAPLSEPEASPEPAPQPGMAIISMLREDSEELRKEEAMLRLQEEVLRGQQEDHGHLTSQRAAKPEGFLGHFVEQKTLEPEQDQPWPEISVREPISPVSPQSRQNRSLLSLPELQEMTAESSPCPTSPPPGILSPKSGGALLQVPETLSRSATNSSIGSGSKKSVSFSLCEDGSPPKKKYNYRAVKAKQDRPTSEKDGVMWHLLPG